MSEAQPTVAAMSSSAAARLVVAEHYLHRRPPISHAYGMIDGVDIVGCVTFGVPASRAVQKSACPTEPDAVLELNRLWIRDDQPHGLASWFVSRSLRRLPPRIVVSYADTAVGHHGGVYRAMSWHYAGWTDMDRKTPRCDYVPLDPTKHSREASRSGVSHKVRRKPKVKFWTVSGSPAERRRLRRLAGWPTLDWGERPPPTASGEAC